MSAYPDPSPGCIPTFANVKSEFSVDGLYPRIRYLSRQADLILAGVATADMFPARGKKRKSAPRGTDSRHPDYFAVTRRGVRFLLTRWAYWNDPANQARMLKEEPGLHLHLRPAQRAEPAATKLAPAKAESRTARLSDDAIAVAEGWSILPVHLQDHVTMLIKISLGANIPH